MARDEDEYFEIKVGMLVRAKPGSHGRLAKGDLLLLISLPQDGEVYKVREVERLPMRDLIDGPTLEPFIRLEEIVNDFRGKGGLEPSFHADLFEIAL